MFVVNKHRSHLEGSNAKSNVVKEMVLGLHLLSGAVMVFLHPCEDKVILMYLGKLTFLLSIKRIENCLLKLEMSVQGALILVLLVMIYIFPRVQNACHLHCPLGTAIAAYGPIQQKICSVPL